MNRRTFLKGAALSAGVLLASGRLPRTRATGESFPVYLTFDDGPTTSPDGTSGPTISVLDTLQTEKVPATFFLHGIAINDWEGPVISRIISDGHHIGNHLWRQGGNTVKDDSPLALLAQQFIVAEKSIRSSLQKTDKAAYNTYLAQPKMYRRPGGNNGLTGFLDRQYYEMLTREPYLRPYLDQMPWLKEVYDYSGWHINGGDGITNRQIQPDTPEKMIRWVFEGGYGYLGTAAYLCTGDPPRRSLEASEGLIILLHDADKVTDEALPTIIKQLKDRGAEFHTLPRPQDKPNTKTVGIGYPATPDPNGAVCAPPA
jgi:peptidoglycan/xylan/chitin deacetylase (PgdA/CDA1 family)